MRARFGVLVLALSLLTTSASADDPQPRTCRDSDRYPVRICTQREEDAEMADLAVLFGERCWELAVEEMGFSPPWRPGLEEGTVEQGLLLDVVPEPGEGADLMVDGPVPETPHADCAVHIRITPNFPEHMIWLRFVYAFLQAAQRADDCTESLEDFLPAYLMLHMLEGTGQGPPSENLTWMSQYFYGSFQANPHFSLDMYYPSLAELSNYHMGQGVFAMYLDERFGSGDGTFLAAAWAAGRQEGVVEVSRGRARLAEGEVNEPDIYDALDVVLSDHDSGFWDAVKEFSIWRLLTGPFAAEGYLKYGALLQSVTIAGRYAFEDLPALGEQPPAAPLETGSVYLNLELGEDAPELQGDRLVLDVSSGGEESWYLAALVFDAEGEHRVVDAEHDGGQARLVVGELEAAQHVVLVITALGDRVHDPDEDDWDPVYFQYDLYVVEQPRITTVRPQQLAAGTNGAAVIVDGSGFGSGLQADLGDGVVVQDLVIDEPQGQLVMVVDVPADAAPGWRPLTLRNELDMEAVEPEGIRIVGGAAPEPLGLDPASGLPGTQLYLRLLGRKLQPGAVVELLGPEGLTLLRADPVDEQEWVLELALSEGAVPGPRDLKVTNPDGQSATLTAAFEVLEPPAPPTPPSEDEDDGCALAGRGGGGSLLGSLAAAAGLALLWRRAPRRQP